MSRHWTGDPGLIQLANMLSDAAQAAVQGEPTSDKTEENQISQAERMLPTEEGSPLFKIVLRAFQVSRT